MSDYLTTQEVAALLRVSPETMRSWRARGNAGPRWFKVGGRCLYANDDVQEFITEARTKGGGEAA